MQNVRIPVCGLNVFHCTNGAARAISDDLYPSNDSFQNKTSIEFEGKIDQKPVSLHLAAHESKVLLKINSRNVELKTFVVKNAKKSIVLTKRSSNGKLPVTLTKTNEIWFFGRFQICLKDFLRFNFIWIIFCTLRLKFRHPHEMPHEALALTVHCYSTRWCMWISTNLGYVFSFVLLYEWEGGVQVLFSNRFVFVLPLELSCWCCNRLFCFWGIEFLFISSAGVRNPIHSTEVGPKMTLIVNAKRIWNTWLDIDSDEQTECMFGCLKSKIKILKSSRCQLDW